MGYPINGSLRQRVLQAVLAGASRTCEVYAKVASAISASKASTACKGIDRREKRAAAKGARRFTGEKRTIQNAISRGKRYLICEALTKLAGEGKIRRIAVGVYGPPLPRVHRTEAG